MGIPVRRASVAGTPFDFRQSAAIGPRMRWPDPQIHMAGGFDHCYCLPSDPRHPRRLRNVASVMDPGSGRLDFPLPSMSAESVVTPNVISAI